MAGHHSQGRRKKPLRQSALPNAGSRFTSKKERMTEEAERQSLA